MSCTFPNCDHEVFVAGLCHGHYAQRRRGVELATLERRDGHHLVTLALRLRPETIEVLNWLQSPASGASAQSVARSILEQATGTVDRENR
jgi:hypothetical protein